MDTSTAHEAVLLVDDDPDILREYGKIVERMGLVTLSAQNGAEALEIMQEKRVDVIVSDLNMPVMGGLAFLREVRGIDLDIPVVLVTGEPELETALAAVEFGAFHYLKKPVEPEKLRQTVARAVRFHGLAKLQRQANEYDELPSGGLRDRASLEARLDSAIEKLWMAVQPIVRCSARSIFAYEALVRSREETLPHPEALFSTAERLGRTVELGRAIRNKVSEIIASAPAELFFVNLNPTDLADDELYSESSLLAPFASRIVFEITERSTLAGVNGLSGRLDRLRQKGYRIAIDDLGAGYSSLTSFVHLEPDFVKLDMSLIRGIHTSPRKRSLVRGISQICSRDLSVEVICEGVETKEERDVLIEDGLDLLQGYYFARPSEPFPKVEFLDPC
jgi:EAL domain-containing protein (putative c-di-GMP-specific phosphodiesterase class I)/CheY-like chemotaxis protein